MPLLGVFHAGDIDLLSSIIPRFIVEPLLKPILLYLAKLAEISSTRKRENTRDNTKQHAEAFKYSKLRLLRPCTTVRTPHSP